MASERPAVAELNDRSVATSNSNPDLYSDLNFKNFNDLRAQTNGSTSLSEFPNLTLADGGVASEPTARSVENRPTGEEFPAARPNAKDVSPQVRETRSSDGGGLTRGDQPILVDPDMPRRPNVPDPGRLYPPLNQPGSRDRIEPPIKLPEFDEPWLGCEPNDHKPFKPYRWDDEPVPYLDEPRRAYKYEPGCEVPPLEPPWSYEPIEIPLQRSIGDKDMRQALAANFDEMDDDGDGIVTKTELKLFLEKHMRFGKDGEREFDPNSPMNKQAFEALQRVYEEFDDIKRLSDDEYGPESGIHWSDVREVGRPAPKFELPPVLKFELDQSETWV